MVRDGPRKLGETCLPDSKPPLREIFVFLPKSVVHVNQEFSNGEKFILNTVIGDQDSEGQRPASENEQQQHPGWDETQSGGCLGTDKPSMKQVYPVIELLSFRMSFRAGFTPLMGEHT